MNLEINKTGKIRPFLLIELIQTFTEQEIEGFVHFVACQHFNTDQYALRLIKMLRKRIWNRKDFDKSMQYLAYQEAFPDRPAPQKELSKPERGLLNAKMSLLVRLAETFLSIEGMDKKPETKSELLYSELLERGQYWLFNRNIKKDKKELDSIVERDIFYHKYHWKIEEQVLDYLHQKGQLVKTDNLADLNYHLDVFYMQRKYSLYVTALSLAVISDGKSYDHAAMEAVFKLKELPNYSRHPFIRVHEAIRIMMEIRSDDAYIHLLKMLDEHETSLSQKDLRGSYVMATIFCSIQIVQGNQAYNRKVFELYQIMHQKDLFRENGFIDTRNIKNVVTASCRTNEFDWAAEIIENYRSSIQHSIRSSVCHFNHGLIAFYKKDYKEAIRHFIRVDKVNLVYDINCRIMLLKSHYETDKEYDERTMQIFRSTGKYIQENKSLSSAHRKAYKNFIQALINLYRVRHKATKITLERVKEKLEKFEVFTDKQWLIEKIGELE